MSTNDHRATTSTRRPQPRSIRDKFDDNLNRLQISTFAIFSEDLWQPGMLIHQEIDTNLYYPELTFAGPPKSFYRHVSDYCNQRRDSNVEPHAFFRFSRFRGTIVTDARQGPASKRGPNLDRLDWAGPFGQTFLKRERVRSVAIFLRDPDERSDTTSTASAGDLLFFNFRKPVEQIWDSYDGSLRGRGSRSLDASTPRQRFLVDIQSLACEILDYLPTLVRAQSERSRQAAVRSMRSISGLVQATEYNELHQTGPHKLYSELATGLRDSLMSLEERKVHNHARDEYPLIVSIYLLEQADDDRRETVSLHNIDGVASFLATGAFAAIAVPVRHPPRSFVGQSPLSFQPNLGLSKSSNSNLHLLQRNNYFLELQGSSLSTRDNDALRDTFRFKSPTQWYSDSFNRVASITTLTVATNLTYVLHRVDRFVPRDSNAGACWNSTLETSVPLTRRQALVATRDCGWPMLLESEYTSKLRSSARSEQYASSNSSDGPHESTSRSESLSGLADQSSRRSLSIGTAIPGLDGVEVLVVQPDRDPPPGGALYRLVIRHPHGMLPVNALLDEARESKSEDLKAKAKYARKIVRGVVSWLARQPLGVQWRVIPMLIFERLRMQPAHVFGQLDEVWKDPSSEVCVPIRYEGQPIGCINIESKTINRFNPSYIGMLSLFTRFIEKEYARRVDRALELCAGEVISKLHDAVTSRDPATSASPALPNLFEDRFALNTYARKVAQASWATRAFVATTPTHVDGSVKFIAVSDPVVHSCAGWPLPRSQDGWTMRLAKARKLSIDELDASKLTCPHEIVGVALWDDAVSHGTRCQDKSLEDEPGGADYAYWIVNWKSEPGSCDRSDGAHNSLELVPVCNPVSIKKLAGGTDNSRFYLAWRIQGDHDEHGSDGLGQGVLWLTYADPLFMRPSESVRDNHRYRQEAANALARVFDVSKRTWRVLDKWNSPIVQVAGIESGGSHSPLLRAAQEIVAPAGAIECADESQSQQGIAESRKRIGLCAEELGWRIFESVCSQALMSAPSARAAKQRMEWVFGNYDPHSPRLRVSAFGGTMLQACEAFVQREPIGGWDWLWQPCMQIEWADIKSVRLSLHCVRMTQYILHLAIHNATVALNGLFPEGQKRTEHVMRRRLLELSVRKCQLCHRDRDVLGQCDAIECSVRSATTFPEAYIVGSREFGSTMPRFGRQARGLGMELMARAARTFDPTCEWLKPGDAWRCENELAEGVGGIRWSSIKFCVPLSADHLMRRDALWTAE